MENSININSFDYSSIGSFSLKWRFIKPEHTLLSEKELSLIKPINSSKSEEVCRSTLKYFKDRVLNIDKFEKIEEFDTSKDQDSVKKWLVEIIPNDGDIIISWDNQNCVLTPKKLFCNRWDDFCYPTSDDVVILPHDGNWVLSYAHYEQFQFGILKGMK